MPNLILLNGNGENLRKSRRNRGDNFVAPRQSHNEKEGKGGEDDLHDSNNFSSSLDCVITCQQSSLLSLKEKSSKFLKLIEENSGRVEAYKIVRERNQNASDEQSKFNSEDSEESPLKQLPLETYEFDSEEEKDNSEEDWREIDETHSSFESICGLEEIKDSLFNILIYPSLYPQFFPRRIRWNQVLLYGPPGTGKTMLAKALASEINATLHRITSADLLSHWQGQTERQIKNLFQEIQSNSETNILFFDEIDGLFRRRSNDESDNTRRIKTELLIHLDDFTAEFGNHRSFLLGATNCPWEIDLSFMRRFHKKIYVPLPNKEARLNIIKRNFENIETDLSDSEWNKIGDETEGYSGSELLNVVMTSCCVRFSEMKKCKHWKARGDFWTPVNSCSLFSTEMNFEDIHPEKVTFRNIIFSDLVEAIGKNPKSVEPELLLKYLEYSEKNKIE